MSEGLKTKKNPTRQVPGCVGLTQGNHCRVGEMIRVLQCILVVLLMEFPKDPLPVVQCTEAFS